MASLIDVDPADVRAVVVGLEKYIGWGWDVPGPAKDALRFTEWLRKHGVPPDHIHLWISPLAGSRKPSRAAARKLGVTLNDEEVSRDKLMNVFTVNLADQEHRVLFVFWGGHGMQYGDDLVLFTPDAADNNKRCIGMAGLRRHLTDRRFRSTRQILLVDACANFFDPARDIYDPAVASFPGGVPRGVTEVHQFTLLATGAGQTAENDAAAQGGAFSAAVIDWLDRYTNGLDLDLEALTSGVKSHFDQMGSVGYARQRPTSITAWLDGSKKLLFDSQSARPSALSAGGASLANPSLLALLGRLAGRITRKATANNAVLVDRGQIQVPWKIMRHGSGAAALPGARFAGPQHLPSVLTSTPSGQLVIVGDLGSGKSVMAEQLLLQLLAYRRKGDRVPVLFRLSSWNPRVESLIDWMLNQLLEEDEEVAAMVARAGARDDVRGTLVQQCIFPVLDGFDEIPEGLRREAVEGLNSTLTAYGLPVVLTCRTEDFTRARAALEILPAATVLSIGSLDPDTVRSYLLSPTQGGARDHWKRVFNALDAPGRELDGGDLVDVLPYLTSPLMAWLASTVYSGGTTPAVAFAHGSDVADPESLEKHLLAALVPEVFRRGIASADGRPVSRTGPEDAQRWLTFLARSLPPEGLRQISWWKIPDLAPMRGLALFAGAGGGLVFGVIAGCLPDLALSSAHSLAFGLFFGFGYGTAYSAARAKGVAQDGRTGYGGRVPGTDIDTATYVRVLGFGLVPVLLFWVTLSVLYAPVVHDVSRVLVAVGCGVVAATVIGLIGGIITGVILRSAKRFDAAVAGARAASPPIAVRKDRGATVGAAVLATLVSGCIAAFTTHAAYGLDFVPGLSGGFLGVVTTCMVFNLWPGFRLANVWLALNNKLPWCLIAFLEEARSNGVLRQEGISYTFRHLRLLDSLAEPRKTR